jgi:tetratricopeptide (TPR) repeat protein
LSYGWARLTKRWALALSLAGGFCYGLQSGAAPDLEHELKQGVADHPDNFEANYNLGEFYLHAGKLAEAVPYMERAHRADRGHYACGYDLALAEFELRNYPGARQVIRAMLARQDSAELHGLLGDVDEKAGNFVAALKEYQTAARLDPSEAHIVDLGSELLTHENRSAAVAVFERGVQLFPQSYKLHVGLGIAEYQVSNFDQAAKEFSNAAGLNPQANEAYLLLGLLHGFPAGRTPEAEELLRRFIARQPKNARGYLNLAMMYWDRDRDDPENVERVEELLKQAISLDAQFDEAYLQLGILHAHRSEYRAAIVDLQRAVQVNPNLTQAYFQLGAVYRHTGDAAQADANYRRYRELRQQEKDADEKRRAEMTRFVISMKQETAQASQ